MEKGTKTYFRQTADIGWIEGSIKKRAAIFRESGQCQHWKRLAKAIKKTLSFCKAEYNKKQKVRLEESGRTGQWWNISKFLVSGENPRQWTVADLNTKKTAVDLAQDLAVYFTEITNLSESLRPGQIPQSAVGPT